MSFILVSHDISNTDLSLYSKAAPSLVPHCKVTDLHFSQNYVENGCSSRQEAFHQKLDDPMSKYRKSHDRYKRQSTQAVFSEFRSEERRVGKEC